MCYLPDPAGIAQDSMPRRLCAQEIPRNRTTPGPTPHREGKGRSAKRGEERSLVATLLGMTILIGWSAAAGGLRVFAAELVEIELRAREFAFAAQNRGARPLIALVGRISAPLAQALPGSARHSPDDSEYSVHQFPV